MAYSFAFSPCPNDTFMMHGLMTGKISSPGVEFDISLHDIQELNVGMASERFDLCKVSSVAALRHEDTYEILSSGAAIGYGVGPLVVKRADAAPLNSSSRIVCPGVNTTASALFRYFYPQHRVIGQRIFSDIMPALVRGKFDYGVVIHEGRFTYRDLGLECESDLGARWEQRFAAPLPLGCVVAHTRVAHEVRRAFEGIIKSSIEYGYAHRDEALGTMRLHAQELSDAALWSHVELYVNQWSLDLGASGRKAFGLLREVCGSEFSS